VAEKNLEWVKKVDDPRFKWLQEKIEEYYRLKEKDPKSVSSWWQEGWVFLRILVCGALFGSVVLLLTRDGLISLFSGFGIAIVMAFLTIPSPKYIVKDSVEEAKLFEKAIERNIKLEELLKKKASRLKKVWWWLRYG